MRPCSGMVPSSSVDDIVLAKDAFRVCPGVSLLSERTGTVPVCGSLSWEETMISGRRLRSEVVGLGGTVVV